ncbi:hypothetical protein ACGFNV_03615 [Streptomyces sp. NPDC048751]|uniref:hypothetical protein n=1 Tax=Streptomyces sp. NPDC048751 TaxID=3365591 RepID=UPI00371A45DE
MAVAVGLCTLTTTTGVATAANGSARTDFAAQAKGLGLTSAQAHELQRRVDSYLSETGGTQVSVNKIRLGDRGEILLALPGESTVRTANAPRKPASELCPGNTMCAWKGTWYTGDKIKMWACYNYRIPWLENGSWINNQSTGTVANFLDDYGVSKWHDDGAFSQDPDAPWYWVHWVKNC